MRRLVLLTLLGGTACAHAPPVAPAWHATAIGDGVVPHATTELFVRKVESYDPATQSCPLVDRPSSISAPSPLPHTCVELADATGAARGVLSFALDVPLPLYPADKVSIALREEGERKVRTLTIRRDGALIFFDGTSNLLGAMDIPSELHIERGASRGSTADECGHRTYYDLEVTVGSARASLHYGERMSVGGYTILHGGVAEGTLDAKCMDWTGDDAHVVIVAR